jgi:aryl-alcohol dehydrogenase-like predicted oxidoreductase
MAFGHLGRSGLLVSRIGLGTMIPLHAGLLAGALEAGAEDERIEAHRDQLEAYEGLCRELDARPAHVALA